MNGHLLCEPLLHPLVGTHARTFSASYVLDPLRNPIKTLICSYQTLLLSQRTLNTDSYGNPGKTLWVWGQGLIRKGTGDQQATGAFSDLSLELWT